MKRTCTWKGCSRKHLSKGLCSVHYARQRSGADMNAPIGKGAKERGIEVDEAPPSSEGKPSRLLKGSPRDVIKRFRKLLPLLGLDPAELLEQAQVNCALDWLNRIQAAAMDDQVRGGSGDPRLGSGMFLPPKRVAPVSSHFETDELDSPRRAKLKDTLKGGSAECDGCGGVVTCHKTCTVRKYPVAGAA